jgi:hypothetical protein
MIREKYEQYRQVGGKKRSLLAVAPLVFVGVIDLTRAWHKHDPAEGITPMIIFFIFVPVLAWLAYRIPGRD